LNRQRKTRTFLQQKDSDIASRIAQEAGVTLQASDSQVTHDYVLQAGQTDLEFLRARARSVGFELLVEGKTLHFRPVSNAEGEILTLSLDDDLLEFYPRLSTLRQYSELEVRGWDPKAKQEIVGLARSGDEVARMGGREGGAAVIEGAFGASAAVLGDFPVRTQAEADRVALGRFNSMALQLIGGEGVARGNTQIRAGKVIKLDSLGQRFSGSYYVTAAIHRYSARHAYHTQFMTRRNAS
jgi:phage protein D